MKKIEIEWKGETLSIAEDQWFELAEAVEEVITLIDIHEITVRPKLTKIARAFSVMINFAGGSATPAEVHRDMLRQLGESRKSGKAQKPLIAANAIMVLAQVIMGGAQDDDTAADDVADPGATEKKHRRKRVRRS